MPPLRQSDSAPLERRNVPPESVVVPVALRLVADADDKLFVDQQNACLVRSIVQRAHANTIPRIHAIAWIKSPWNDMAGDQEPQDGQSAYGTLLPITAEDDRSKQSLVDAYFRNCFPVESRTLSHRRSPPVVAAYP